MKKSSLLGSVFASMLGLRVGVAKAVPQSVSSRLSQIEAHNAEVEKKKALRKQQKALRKHLRGK